LEKWPPGRSFRLFGRIHWPMVPTFWLVVPVARSRLNFIDINSAGRRTLTADMKNSNKTARSEMVTFGP
jgi:hypothetical protein